MLWDVVYEFFVKHIFGGCWWDGTVTGNIRTYNSAFYIPLGHSNNGMSTAEYQFTFLGQPYWSFGNYLSLIATIISMVVLVVLCCQIIKKIYNICAHVIG